MSAPREDHLQTENVRLRKLLVQAGIDAAASDVADKLQKLLIAELHHRVKNLLAMVLSITSHTLRGAPTVEHAQEAIQSRIMILSRSFDLLAQGDVNAAPVKSVVDHAIKPYNADGRFTVAIPSLRIASLPAMHLALIVNELSTNAMKYGALSNDNGTVSVVGSLDDDNLTLVWTEKGGPPVKPPTSKSFGTVMISSLMPDAQVGFDFDATGLECRFLIPLATLCG